MTPAALARTLALPALTPVAIPSLAIVATAASDVDQVNVVLATALPPPSRATAVNLIVLPASTDALSGDTTTVWIVGGGGLGLPPPGGLFESPSPDPPHAANSAARAVASQ